MNIHESGAGNPDTIVLLHPLGTRWDIFEPVIPPLSVHYHLVIPAIPGHDPEDPESEFTSIEEIAKELEKWLRSHGYGNVACLYGCSMGGAVVTRLLADHRIGADLAIIDGGITPYHLPKPITGLIGVRDWGMMMLGKYMSVKALRGVFSADKYSPEDLQYVKDVLKGLSSRTIWRAFYSTNNYTMPKRIPPLRTRIQYWYGEEEEKDRAWDMEYIRKTFTTAEFIKMPGLGHAEFLTLHPVEFFRKLADTLEAAMQAERDLQEAAEE